MKKMTTETKFIAVRDIVKNYKDNADEGVVGFDGKLNIRPAYQREYVYDDKKRDAVMDTIINDLPLGLMYWCDNEDGTFEVLDGQQRIISICQYVDGVYSINERYFHNLNDDEQNQILDYECMVSICHGTDTQKLAWFERINVAGEPLKHQELRNATYTGKWLYAAKRSFSKNNCWAKNLADRYLKGEYNRQDILETALAWISGSKNNITEYMANHQHDENADELKAYFSKVIDWVDCVFPKYHKEMKGVDWGRLYNEYHNNEYTISDQEICDLLADEDVTKKSGVFEYLLSLKTNEKVLSIRTFKPIDISEMYAIQGGICPICNKHYEIGQMQADHKIAWSKGGKTTKDNLQMLCTTCNLKKSSK